MQSGHVFSQIPQVEIERSSFNRSHGHKSTFNSGLLVPIFADEALPGDTFSLQGSLFARLATPIFPIMDNMWMETFFFSVPVRLIWDNWQRFNGEQRNPGDSTDYVVPQMVSPSGGYLTGSLSDYLGLPIKVAGLSHSTFWHRAYNLIFREWFRNENLIDSPVVDTDDGPDDPADYVLRRRNKRADYFVSALPWPQKGDAVTVPIGGSAPVTGSGSFTANAASLYVDSLALAGNTHNSALYADASTGAGNVHLNTLAPGTGPLDDPAFAYNAAPTGVGFTGLTGPVADLSSATAITINALRQAFQVQRLLERDARGGTRYTEILRAHFGVVSPDARLQRPEYLGGGSTPVSISPVPQTSVTASTPQGNLAAFGVAAGNSGHGFVASFTEHCVVLGLVCVRADLTYQQGMNKMFSRSTRFDFFWPALAHLGEQPIFNREIYTQGTSDDALVFGYQERYAEYRYKPSLITGQFRSTATDPLDAWHLAQDFTSLPLLNQAFVEEHPPVPRVIAVDSQPEFIFDSFWNYVCARPMPVFGVPGLIDHF